MQSFVNLNSYFFFSFAANAGYQCDYFVHYYNLTYENSGRSGAGGSLDPHEVRLLSNAVDIYTVKGKERMVVEYQVDEEAYFWQRYKALLNRIHNTTDSNGKYVYYPWKARTYKVRHSRWRLCMETI